MRVKIVARHCEVPDSVRERAEEQLGKLSKYEPRLSGAEVVFETEKRLKRSEAVLKVDREEPVVAGGEGEEFRDAVDQMVDRLSRMLKRRRSQRRERHGSGTPKAAALEE
ncbi:ribosome hibernation-promoting factor, HPF/YfiA family [Gemmatimonadota bacterium]